MNAIEAIPSTCIEVVSSADKLAIIEEKSLSSEGREDYQDGFYICDLGNVVNNYQRWTKAFPRIFPHYAVKCNPDVALIKMLLALGAGFDCASKGEIQQLLELGAQPEKIIFAHPCKQFSHIRYARENGIQLVVVDNEEELVKMKSYFPDAELVLRIQTDDARSPFPMSKKFGANMKLSRHLIDLAFEMGLTISGISFHVGTRCHFAEDFAKAFQDAKTLFDYASTVGFKFDVLDIGGGFPGCDTDNLSFEKFVPIVNENAKKLFPEDKFEHVRIIAEPGRYFAESAFTLATNVIAKKKVPGSVTCNGTGASSVLSKGVPSPSEDSAFMYYINDGIYGTFACMVYDGAVPVPRLLKPAPERATEFASSIWGPSCDGQDHVVEHVMLPELNISDWLVWKNVGAYSIAASSSFNGFRTNKIFYAIAEDDLALLHSLTGTKCLPNFEVKWKDCKAQKC